MIFATVGTMPFLRLVAAMDAYAGQTDERVLIQTATTAHECQHAESERYVSDIDPHLRAARLVVGHIGSGTTWRLLELGKPFVLVPRRAALGEHFDDHQWELAEHLKPRLPAVIVDDIAELGQAIADAPARLEQIPFISTRSELISTIRCTVHELCGFVGPE